MPSRSSLRFRNTSWSEPEQTLVIACAREVRYAPPSNSGPPLSRCIYLSETPAAGRIGNPERTPPGSIHLADVEVGLLRIAIHSLNEANNRRDSLAVARSAGVPDFCQPVARTRRHGIHATDSSQHAVSAGTPAGHPYGEYRHHCADSAAEVTSNSVSSRIPTFCARGPRSARTGLLVSDISETVQRSIC